MTYATQIHMETRFGLNELVLLTDASGSGFADAAQIAAQLAAADEVIDGYVATRYALPLAPVPGVIVSMACDIARYKLHRDGAPDKVKDAYVEALARLKDIQAGKFILQSAGVTAVSAPSPAIAGPAFSAPGRVFSSDALGDMI
jgi:phage gp36-like protein